MNSSLLQPGFSAYYSTYVEVVACYKCGVLFGLADRHYNALLSMGGDFYCSNGHCQHFTESYQKKLEKVKVELELQKQVALDRQKELEKQRASTASYKGKLTKIKRRVKNGVCPCCNRTFINLGKHMKTKHPRFNERED